MDIEKPRYLHKIANTHKFLIPELVQSEVQGKLGEIRKSGNYRHIARNKNIRKWNNQIYNPEVIIGLFFGPNERRYGEHEVIGHALRMAYRNADFCMIIDEYDKQDWVKKNTPHIYNKMRWTTDFIADCGCISQALVKADCIDILERMGLVSTLRVPPSKYENVKNRLKSC